MRKELINNNIVDIQEPVYVDNSIESYEYVSFPLQNDTQINQDGEVLNINVQATDRYLFPSDSYILLEGKLVNQNNVPFAANSDITLINNGPMYLFKSIEFYVDDHAVERIHNPGQTTSILGYMRYPDDYNSTAGMSICWSKDSTDNADSDQFVASAAAPAANYRPERNPDYNEGFAKRKAFLNSANPRGEFSFQIPFSHIFGFAEYKKFIYNRRLTLNFTRASDTLAIYKSDGVGDARVTLTKMIWLIPELKFSTETKTEILKSINSKAKIPLSYTNRTCIRHEIPNNAFSYDFRQQLTDGPQKPRWIIVGFQHNKHSDHRQNPAVFDHQNLVEATAELNGKPYPQQPRNINFNRNQYSSLYEAMHKFKENYYGYDSLVGNSQISYSDFKTLFPLVVFDVRHQSEILKSGVVDLQLHFKFEVAVPQTTYMYVIVLSDMLYEMEVGGGSMTKVFP